MNATVSTLDYWQQRAVASEGRRSSTTDDVYLRDLEIRTFAAALSELNLPAGAKVLDLGCGDGYSTLRLAQQLTSLRFLGVDFAPGMVATATENLAEVPDLSGRIDFRQGDARELDLVLGEERFDAILTDRCLINLLDSDVQYQVLESIASHLVDGGHYLGIENFLEGQEQLNAARRSLGLSEIPVREHNHFFREGEFRRRTGDWFDLVRFDRFSSGYYYATRIVYSKMAADAGEAPDYEHPIHRLAVDAPATGNFSPICLAVLRKRPALSADSRTQLAKFQDDRRANIDALGADDDLWRRTRAWMVQTSAKGYSYHFEWMGRPIIQYPQDIVAMQELIWRVRPSVIVETGIAHGGSLVLYASMLELLGGPGRIIGIDIDIREHNRQAILAHPMARRIEMIQGSSIDPAVVEDVRQRVGGEGPVMVVLDSNHTHEHVLEELKAYSPLVSAGSYLVVFDTIVEDLPGLDWSHRPWGIGDNPKTAVHEFLKSTDRFAIDRDVQNKLLVTVAPDGYLKCLKD